MSSGESLSCHGAKRGSILIITLWAVFFLGLLAVAVGSYAAAQIELARRMSERVGARYVAKAGVEKSIAILQLDTNAWDALSERWANSPEDFQDIALGDGVYSVFYAFDKADGTRGTNYGVCDEQARMDLNKGMPPASLGRLLQIAGGVGGPEQARLLVANIRRATMLPPKGTEGSRDLDTGWVDAAIPCGPLRSVHEVLWVKGMSRVIFNGICDHVTVNGGTNVNINTADRMVLLSLFSRGGGKAGSGVSENLIRKILNFREHGGIFKSSSGLVETLDRQGDLSQDERSQLASGSSVVTVKSDHFRGYARGELRGRPSSVQTVRFVWDRKQKKIEYWNED